MTDRSSQPCSSESESKQVTKSVNGTSRTFTIRINKKNGVEKQQSKNPKLNLGPAVDASTNRTNNIEQKSKTDTSGRPAKQSKSSEAPDASISRSEQSKKATASKNKQQAPTESQAKVSLPKISGNIDYPSSHKPAVIHSLFDPKRQKFNPARPLTDFPEPAPQDVYQTVNLSDLFNKFEEQDEQTKQDNLRKQTIETLHKAQAFEGAVDKLKKNTSNRNNQEPKGVDANSSKWQLIQSPDLSEHLELLKAGGLAKFPKSFYKNNSIQPLLTSIEQMQLIDISKIISAVEQLNVQFKDQGILTRRGFVSKRQLNNKLTKRDTSNNRNTPIAEDICSLSQASDWESILYPQRFDTDEASYGSLTTDIMAVSVTKHALAQCPTRQSMNKNFTATEITDYLRSYLLTQSNQLPYNREPIKHIHIYAGHIIVVAKMLGWQIAIIEEGESTGDIMFNVSARCGLFTRYPVLGNYYINGWT